MNDISPELRGYSVSDADSFPEAHGLPWADVDAFVLRKRLDEPNGANRLQKEGLVGERAIVSFPDETRLLLLDVNGFSGLAASLAPQELTAFLQEFVARSVRLALDFDLTMGVLPPGDLTSHLVLDSQVGAEDISAYIKDRFQLPIPGRQGEFTSVKVVLAHAPTNTLARATFLSPRGENGYHGLMGPAYVGATQAMARSSGFQEISAPKKAFKGDYDVFDPRAPRVLSSDWQRIADRIAGAEVPSTPFYYGVLQAVGTNPETGKAFGPSDPMDSAYLAERAFLAAEGLSGVRIKGQDEARLHVTARSFPEAVAFTESLLSEGADRLKVFWAEEKGSARLNYGAHTDVVGGAVVKAVAAFSGKQSRGVVRGSTLSQASRLAM